MRELLNEKFGKPVSYLMELIKVLTEQGKYFFTIIAMSFYFIAGYLLRRRGVKMTNVIYCGLAIVSVLIFALPYFAMSTLPLKIKIYITVSAVVLIPVWGLIVRIFGKTAKMLIKPEGKDK